MIERNWVIDSEKSIDGATTANTLHYEFDRAGYVVTLNSIRTHKNYVTKSETVWTFTNEPDSMLEWYYQLYSGGAMTYLQYSKERDFWSKESAKLMLKELNDE